MSDRTYRLWLGGLYLLGVLSMFLQPIRTILSPAYKGLLAYRGADESLYLIRLQEGLINPLADTSNGIWGGAHDTTGMQMALMERFGGWLLGWTNLDATWAALIISAFAAPTALLLGAALMRKCGATKTQAIVLSVLFFIVMGMFKRYFNPSWSMPLTMLTMLSLWRWWESLRWRDALFTGFLLGLLPGIYFWSWTFCWGVFGIMALYIIDARNREDFRMRVVQYLAAGGMSLAVGAHTLWRIYQASHHPLFPESSLRMGILYTRELESLPRSLLIFFMALGALMLWRKRESRFVMAPLLSMAVSAFVVMHQQFVHGRIMSFSSHYYWYVCLTAILILAGIIGRKAWRAGAAFAGIAALTLLGGAWMDYHGRLDSILAPTQRSMEFQHLAPAIASLKDGPREVVLTDKATSNLLASTTNDDVVFTDYSRILLVSNQEYIERYCLSEALSSSPIDAHYIPEFNEEQSRAGREMTRHIYDMFERMSKDICAKVDANVPFYLDRYEVTTVLWNSREKPDWVFSADHFKLREEGEGWQLFDVIDR
jgi:hypothetical protein